MIILRGPSGCGKSTLAQKICDYARCPYRSHIFSTDDKFLDHYGRYKFRPELLPQHHATNQRQVMDACTRGISPIVVDNTNTMRWEMKPYVSAAVANNYVLILLTVETPWSNNVKQLVTRSVHGVPKESIRNMVERFQRATPADLLYEFGMKYTAELPQQRTDDNANGPEPARSATAKMVANHHLVCQQEQLAHTDWPPIIEKHMIGCINENTDFTFVRELFPRIPVTVLWVYFQQNNCDGNATVDAIYNCKQDEWASSSEDNDNSEFSCDCNQSDGSEFGAACAQYSEQKQWYTGFMGEDDSVTKNLDSNTSASDLPSSDEFSRLCESIDDNNEQSIWGPQTVELDIGVDTIRSLYRAFSPAECPLPSAGTVVHIPQHFAKYLFSMCLESLYFCNKENCESDALLAEWIQKNDCDLDRTLVNEEPAKDDAVYNVWKRKEPFNLVANLKRDKLISLFPHIDADLVLGIYEACDYNYKNAVDYLSGMDDTPKYAPTADSNPVKENNERKQTVNAPVLITDYTNYSYPVVKNGKLKNPQRHPMRVYEDYRHQAQYHAQLHRESLQKSTSTQKGNCSKYFRYLREFHALSNCIANNISVNLLLSEFLAGRYTQIDLHYMHINEAKMTLALFLNAHIRRIHETSQSTASVNVITGWGKHSNDGVAKLKEFVKDHCSKRNLRWEEINIGMVKIYLQKSSELYCEC